MVLFMSAIYPILLIEHWVLDPSLQNIWEQDALSSSHTSFGAESVDQVLARTVGLVEVCRNEE